MYKKIINTVFIALGLLIVFAAALPLRGIAAPSPEETRTYCVNIYDGSLYIGNHCATWTFNRKTNPYKIACVGNGSQSVTWKVFGQGYSWVTSQLKCTPQYYTTDKATTVSKVSIYKNGVYKTYSQIKCTFPADQTKPGGCTYTFP